MSIDPNYIERIPYTATQKLQPVKADPFFDALEQFYEKDKKTIELITRQKVVAYLTDTYQGTGYDKGLKAFGDWLQETVGTNGEISGEYQKYLADVTHKIAYGTLRLNK